MIPPGAPFFAYGVGLGSPEQYATVLEQRDRLRGLWVRNAEDVEALRAQGVPAEHTPDLALLLGDAVRARPAHPAVPPPGPGARKRLAFCPSGNADQTALQRGDVADLMYNGYLKVALARALDELAAYYDVLMLPLSHDYKDMDLAFIGQVHGLMRCGDRATPVTEELDPLDAAAAIGACRLCVSMKLHGLVFAALSGVPFVNVGLTRKTVLLCESLGQGGLSIPPYTFTQGRLMAAVKAAEAPETAPAIRGAVAGQVARAQAAADAFRARVLEAL
jgi:polysaccharide pyruvyl transferase WcaK-like protein